MPIQPVTIGGSFGKPQPPRGWPQIVGWGHSANDVSSVSINVQNPMQLGDVIFACFGSQQVGGPSISGLGATWQTISRQTNAGGAQVDTSLWMGRVLSFPSASQTISASWTNQGQFQYVIFRGLEGRLVASQGTINAGGGGSLTLPSMRGESPTGVLVAMGYTRGSFSSFPNASGMSLRRINFRAGGVGANALYYAPYKGETAAVNINSSGNEVVIACIVV